VSRHGLKPVLDAARRMNDPDILRQVHTRFIVTRVRMCIQTEGDHFGRLLNRIVKLISFPPSTEANYVCANYPQSQISIGT